MRHGAATLVAVGLGLGLGSGCVDSRPSATTGQVAFLGLEMVDPPPDGLGSASAPLTARQVTFDLFARDEQGQPFAGEAEVDVFMSFGGVKSGTASGCELDGPMAVQPILRLRFSGGELRNQTVMLPPAFGPASLWAEETSTHAVGASPTLRFRNPLISDIQTPLDLSASNATFCTPFERKFVIIDRPTGAGSLVISSVFGNAFAVSDTGATSFNSLFVFTFGRPPAWVVPGKVLHSISGNVSKFIGFTELNFPLYDGDPEEAPNPALIPAPTQVVGTDVIDVPKLLGLIASPVEVTAYLCNPDPPNPNNDANIQDTKDQWRKFNTFLLDDGAGTCDAFNHFSVQLPAKSVSGFDPTQHVGEQVTLRGMLKNSSGQNKVLDANENPVVCDGANPCSSGTCIGGVCKKKPYNFWTIVVRGPADVPAP